MANNGMEPSLKDMSLNQNATPARAGVCILIVNDFLAFGVGLGELGRRPM